jgi:hypothetical protein
MNTKTPRKSLVVCPVGRVGKDFVGKIVQRFGHESFDFLLLVYDDTCFEEDWFLDCTVVHDELPLFWRLRKYVTPELCCGYEYVFIWMDDLDVLDFDPQNYLRILRTHGIEVGHPALSSDSVISHAVMERRDTAIGRYTDFAEILGFTFRGDVWERFWRLIEPDSNPWGWGYDEVAYSVCRFRKMAIIDSEVIKHTRKGSYHAAAVAGQRETHDRYRRYYLSRKKMLCEISEDPLRRHITHPLWLYLHHALARSYILPGAPGVRRFIRTCLNRLRARRSDMAANLPRPVVASTPPQSSFETPVEVRAPVQARDDAVLSELLSDQAVAAAPEEPGPKPKRQRQTPTAKRAEAKARE